jgi:hypothetical protein
MCLDLAAIPASDACKRAVGAVADPTRSHVATDRMRLAGRRHGRGWHASITQLFLMERLFCADRKDGKR